MSGYCRRLLTSGSRREVPERVRQTETHGGRGRDTGNGHDRVRWDASSNSCTCSMASRRREGASTFPQQPPSGLEHPGSGQTPLSWAAGSPSLAPLRASSGCTSARHTQDARGNSSAPRHPNDRLVAPTFDVSQTMIVVAMGGDMLRRTAHQ
jgi:hypothetical protein